MTVQAVQARDCACGAADSLSRLCIPCFFCRHPLCTELCRSSPVLSCHICKNFLNALQMCKSRFVHAAMLSRVSAGDMPMPRYQHGAVFVNARLHISGGAVGGGRMVEDSSSVVTLDTAAGAWVHQEAPEEEDDWGGRAVSQYVAGQAISDCLHLITASA